LTQILTKTTMRKFSFKTAFVAVASLGLFLSSCNTTIEVAKRKHRKGYHVSISNTKSVGGQNMQLAVVDSPAVDTTHEDHIFETPKFEMALLDSPSVDTTHHEGHDHLMNQVPSFEVATLDSPAVDTTHEDHMIPAMPKMSLAKKVKTVNQIRKQFKQLKKSGMQTASYGGDDDWEIDSDVMFVIMILLAIVLPPLAVYLIKGKSNAFILNLLLFLIGYLGLGVATIPNLVWLCALLAIIHALLVVLGHS